MVPFVGLEKEAGIVRSRRTQVNCGFFKNAWVYAFVIY